MAYWWRHWAERFSASASLWQPLSLPGSYRRALSCARIHWTRYWAEINLYNMIEVRNLKKSFKDGDSITEVLKGIDFTAKSGEFIAIMGRSGAGKSTFLYQMSLLDEPTAGEILIDKINTKTLSINQKTDFRLSLLGYVFQDYALLPEMTALENVALPLLMKGMLEKDALTKATEALTKGGLDQRLGNLPSKLSGGEQQRVSIARAIAHEPRILFADEPTANL